VKTVTEFYGRELPSWARNLIEHTGWERVEKRADCIRMVRGYADKDRTITEHSIKPPDYLKTAAQRTPTQSLS
jgi:hypothetical protein